MRGITCSVESVFSDEDFVAFRFNDGRVLAVPKGWFPTLAEASTAQLSNYYISPFGVHWPGLDEDVSVSGLLEGRGAQCVSSDVSSSLARIKQMTGST